MDELGISILRFSDDHVFNEMENVIRSTEQFIIDFQKQTRP